MEDPKRNIKNKANASAANNSTTNSNKDSNSDTNKKMASTGQVVGSKQEEEIP